MKTIFVSILMLFLGLSPLLASEPLAVDKLIYRTTDLSASNAPKDMNGKQCGLLKVITNDKSMTFEGSIVGSPEYKSGEYWIYLSEGTYQVRIKSSNNEPVQLNFRDYNIYHVVSKMTYELTFRQQDLSNIYLSNAYAALNAEQLALALKNYELYKDLSGNIDRLFETELSKADGSYSWSIEELKEAGFKSGVIVNDFDFDENPNYVEYKTIHNYAGEVGQIQYYVDSNCKLIYGNIVNGYVNGIVLLKDNIGEEYESYNLMYVCNGMIISPSLSVLSSPLMIDENDPLKEERNWLFIEETIVSPCFDYSNARDNSDVELWMNYLKLIFTPDITDKSFHREFSLGNVDIEAIKRNFSKFMRSGNKIPSHIWSRF